MLKRISLINNVGSFKRCNAGAIDFSKITLIYGKNTYGKTTLGDIFSSLKSNDAQGVVARRTIPHDEDPQKIKINFAAAGENENQGTAKFRNGVWLNGLRESHHLAIYDDGFYHSHVFSARKLSRETKENFSDFVLGEHGVERAQELASKIEERKGATKAKSDLEKQAFSGVQDVLAFVKRTVVEDIDAAKEALDRARSDYGALNKQRKESAAIRARSALLPMQFPSTFIDSAAKLNEIFVSMLENQHEAAKQELSNHIERCFTKADGAEHWIQQGLGYLKGDSCGFCGQSITPQVNELLDIYRQCFDDQFSRHAGYVNSGIKRYQTGLSALTLDQFLNSLDHAELILQAYPELSSEEKSDGIVSALRVHFQSLREKIENVRLELAEFIPQFENLIKAKLAAPDKPVGQVDISKIEGLFGDISALVEQVNPLVNSFNHNADILKNSLNEENVAAELTRLKQLGEGLAADVKRFEQNDNCFEYQRLTEVLSSLEEDIPRLRQALQDEQAAYLQTYFERINTFFQKLGSRDFTLKPGVSNQGNKTVNYFKVLFKGQSINEAQLDKVFSESDRRALSLAIFFSSLEGMDVNQLSRTVVILDDPVTSFDNERVGRIHSEIEGLADRCEQIIVLSHFKEGIANFLNVQGFHRSDVKVLEITRDHNSSSLREVGPDVFTKNIHHKHADTLIDFVERRTDNIHPLPRVFLEEAVRLRFSKQLRDSQIDERLFSDQIDKMLESGIISQPTAESLHRWRNELNPEHHINLADDIEDRRNTVAQLLDFIYNQLVSAS
ncbi:AAA family ATPase [Aurantivibrio plasticivorans]